jgi:hypothetical protein
MNADSITTTGTRYLAAEKACAFHQKQNWKLSAHTLKGSYERKRQNASILKHQNAFIVAYAAKLQAIAQMVAEHAAPSAVGLAVSA